VAVAVFAVAVGPWFGDLEVGLMHHWASSSLQQRRLYPFVVRVVAMKRYWC
jgi:hypothetical protein